MSGFKLWYAALSGPVHWMVHITGVAALASAACGDSGHGFTLAAHALTVVTGAATVLAIVWSRRLAAAPQGTHRFLGQFGLGVGGLSLLLILLEEAYVWTVRVCG